MAMLRSQQLFAITHCLLVWSSTSVAGLPAGVEIKNLRLCGSHNETAKATVYPWPFVPSRKPANMSVTLTPVVDVLDATIQYELKSVSDGRVILRDRDNLCIYAPRLCSLAAGDDGYCQIRSQRFQRGSYHVFLP
ncbi:uncharacterized protein LOC110043836 [Orbicella faveolata]|uniref:uncharacterized protein LOC110043836 n=1 Tax=Orbicella faveolata TaxID=48498 RepID=UPI0009E57109|nr:uncharacterized protein LOC110043836 [Orbicella faveolata]